MRTTRTFRSGYLIGTVIVWVGIIFAAAVILAGTSYLAQILPILGGGSFWFVVLVPGAFFWKRREPSQSGLHEPVQ